MSWFVTVMVEMTAGVDIRNKNQEDWVWSLIRNGGGGGEQESDDSWLSGLCNLSLMMPCFSLKLYNSYNSYTFQSKSQSHSIITRSYLISLLPHPTVSQTSLPRTALLVFPTLSHASLLILSGAWQISTHLWTDWGWGTHLNSRWKYSVDSWKYSFKLTGMIWAGDRDLI